MQPLGKPGEMTEQERYLFEAVGYLVISSAAGDPHPLGCWEECRFSFLLDNVNQVSYI